MLKKMKPYNVMPVDFELHYENNEWYKTIVWEDSSFGNGGSYGWRYQFGHDKYTALSMVDSYYSQGYYPIDIEVDNYGKSYSFLLNSKKYNYLLFWEENYSDIISEINTVKESNFIPIDIEVHEINGVKKYTGILGYYSNEWDYVLEVTSSEFRSKNKEMYNSGYRPIDYEIHTSEERNLGRILIKDNPKNIEYIDPKLHKFKIDK